MAIFIDTPVQYLKGVGPKLGELLRKRQVLTVGDLLEWYPRSYQDQRACLSIENLEPNQHVSIQANVLRVSSVQMGRSRQKMHEVVVSDGTGRIACKFFRSPYRGYFERYQPHQVVRVTGKVTDYRGGLQFQHPTIEIVGDEESLDDVLMPLYTETEGLSPGKLRKLIDLAIDKLIEHPEKAETKPGYTYERPFGVPEYLPAWLLSKYQLLGRPEALKKIHKPEPNKGEDYLDFKAPAQKRIIFDELFWLELHMALKKKGVTKEKAYALKNKTSFIKKALSELPFELTAAQKKSLDEVLKDLQKPHPMHRLIQGDVGSGKTIVALMSLLFTIENNHQACLMVPTEILADQHFKNAEKMFESFGLKIALLTGNTKASEKKIIYEQLQSGEIQVCIGTHALIQDQVLFKKLGLVIIDEQHRFGVEQRLKLKQKGISPHFLVMTATPIPRTLAMTVYGDLDVSVIDEMPLGRLPIVTRKVFDNKRQKVFEFMQQQVEKGRQAYVVYPLVEESEKIDLKNAVDEFEKLKAQFDSVRFGLLHGKMKQVDKDSIMNDFRDKKIDVLVATTVIEVGVDVPNANMMIVEHAERFGLSQLHQLRGRVGRGSHKSYCVLVLGYAVSEESKMRAEIMVQTANGFKVSEADLEMRGPGQFLGTRQSGLTGFKIANIVRDLEILKQARSAAFELVDKDPDLLLPEHEAIKESLPDKMQIVVG